MKIFIMGFIIIVFLLNSDITLRLGDSILLWNRPVDVILQGDTWIWTGNKKQYDKYLDRELLRLREMKRTLQHENDSITKEIII